MTTWEFDVAVSTHDLVKTDASLEALPTEVLMMWVWIAGSAAAIGLLALAAVQVRKWAERRRKAAGIAARRAAETMTMATVFEIWAAIPPRDRYRQQFRWVIGQREFDALQAEGASVQPAGSALTMIGIPVVVDPDAEGIRLEPNGDG